MNEEARVIVRIEYDHYGSRVVYYGEINEMKLRDLQSGNEDFLWMKNDKEITWIDKHSIVSIDELGVISRVYGDENVESITQGKDTWC